MVRLAAGHRNMDNPGPAIYGGQRMDALFTATLVRADHVRSFHVGAGGAAGWEVVQQQDGQIVHQQRHTDWQRVEHTLGRFTREIDGLRDQGWSELVAARRRVGERIRRLRAAVARRRPRSRLVRSAPSATDPIVADGADMAAGCHVHRRERPRAPLPLWNHCARARARRERRRPPGSLFVSGAPAR